MIVEILNWNTALTENCNNYIQVFEYVKEFLEKPNSIAILHQIPRKDREDDWNSHYVFLEFERLFARSSGYQIFQNDTFNNGYVFMETIIISKMKNVVPASNKYYPNEKISSRESAIVIKGINNHYSVIGIHARNGKQNKEYLQSLNSNSDIIAGDFNAGDYVESENSEVFRNILKEYVCICNMPTKKVTNLNGEIIRKTCIDHIFVKRKFVTQCSHVRVHEDVEFSDHYPITFKFEII